jgi:hypothetical protein
MKRATLAVCLALVFFGGGVLVASARDSGPAAQLYTLRPSDGAVVPTAGVRCTVISTPTAWRRTLLSRNAFACVQEGAGRLGIALTDGGLIVRLNGRTVYSKQSP